MLNAVILNDTRGHHHFGCYKVMETIEAKLLERGIKVSARNMVRRDWEKNRDFLNKLESCDLVLINAEGTLHHGSRHAEKLLKIADHPKRASKPLVLVNALFQDNPDSWKSYLEKFDLLSTRDKKSALELEKLLGKKVYNTLDLSLSRAVKCKIDGNRPSKFLGESVDYEASKFFIELARKHRDFIFLPIVRTLKSSKPQFGSINYWLRELIVFGHAKLLQATLPNHRFCKNHEEYAAELAKGQSHVTGRYHAVCFSLLTRTPFLATSSNSWKIEALLDDIGFTQDRMVLMENLGKDRDSLIAPPFSSEERQLIDTALDQCAKDTDMIFDKIADLVKSPTDS